MPSTLVSTAGAANANSYASLAEANTYHGDHLYASSWEAAENDQKTQALIMATRILDDMADWKGIVASSTQALRWPRSNVLDRDDLFYLDSATIPKFLREATSELARYLIEGDREKAVDEQVSGISSVTADVVSVSFTTSGQDKKRVLPSSVLNMIAAYIEGSPISIPLKRG